MGSPQKKHDARSPRARTRLLVDERRNQLLSLGIRVFAERSYDDVSIDDLARAAGISKGLLYHYFPTKRDFYVAALERASSELLAQTLTADGAPPEERVRLGLETYLDFVEQHGAAYLALMRGGLGADPEVFGILERTRETFVQRIVDEMPKSEVTPLLRTMLRGWIGFVEATSSEWLARREVTRDELVPRIGAVLGQCVALAAGAAQPPAPKKRRA